MKCGEAPIAVFLRVSSLAQPLLEVWLKPPKFLGKKSCFAAYPRIKDAVGQWPNPAETLTCHLCCGLVRPDDGRRASTMADGRNLAPSISWSFEAVWFAEFRTWGQIRPASSDSQCSQGSTKYDQDMFQKRCKFSPPSRHCCRDQTSHLLQTSTETIAAILQRPVPRPIAFHSALFLSFAVLQVQGCEAACELTLKKYVLEKEADSTSHRIHSHRW